MTPKIAISPGAARVPSRVWRDLARNFGDAIIALREEEPLARLDASQWAVLILLLHAWSRAARRPSQTELMRRAGLALRTVRRCLADLERLELAVRLPTGHACPDLAVGPRLAPLLTDFAFGRDPRLWRFDLGRSFPMSSGQPAIQANGKDSER